MRPDRFKNPAGQISANLARSLNDQNLLSKSMVSKLMGVKIDGSAKFRRGRFMSRRV